jgi:hypothetical protein
MKAYLSGALLGACLALAFASRRTHRRLEERGLLLAAFAAGAGAGSEAVLVVRGQAVREALALQAEGLVEAVARDEASRTIERYGLTQARLQSLESLAGRLP